MNPNTKSNPDEEIQVDTGQIGPKVDENGWTDLHIAAIDGNDKKVWTFVKDWPGYIDQKDIYGSTALHFAARWGYTKCLIHLLNHGANVNVTNNIGWTPLHCAVWEGEVNNVVLLVNMKNLNINCQTQNGCTPLHFTARWGYDNIANILLDSMKTIRDISDNDGLTPVHYAAKYGRKNFLQALNERKSLNLYSRSNEGYNIIDYAFLNKNTFDFCVSMKDKYGMQFLEHVSIVEHKKLFQKLLKHFSKKKSKQMFPKNDFNDLYDIKGRLEDEQKIKQILQQHQKLVVTGISGIGKTALVKHYAWTHKEHYQHNLFWVDCQNLESSFIKIAKHLKIAVKKYDTNRDFKTIIKLIFNHLKSNKCLLVFDNVFNIEDVETYLMENPNIDVIIIFCGAFIENDLNCINLGPISPESAVEIFDPLFQDDLLQETDRNNIRSLVEVLKCVPLALHMAKLYIIHKILTNTGFNLAVYIENLNIRGNFEDLTQNDNKKVVYTAMQLNFNGLTQPKLLISCSFLNPSLISIRCAVKLSKLQVDEPNDLQLYIRNSILSLKDNKLSVNRYAKSLAFSNGGTQSNTKKNCYKTVLTLIKTESYPQHLPSILSYAEDFKKPIFEFHSTIILQYLTTYGCLQSLVRVFNQLDRMEIDRYVKKYKLLHAAVRSGHLKTVEFIYKYDNNLERLNDLGHSMVWEAIDKDHTEILNFLISKGASLQKSDKLNKTPLHRAAFLGRLDIVKLLLQKEVDPNIRNKFQRTPLHYAAMEGHNDVIEELLNHKDIKINARDHYRRSPVFETVRCFRVESLKLFIERNARIDTKDNLDLSPVRLAKLQKNKDELLEVFRQHGFYNENETDRSCSTCDVIVCK